MAAASDWVFVFTYYISYWGPKWGNKLNIASDIHLHVCGFCTSQNILIPICLFCIALRKFSKTDFSWTVLTLYLQPTLWLFLSSYYDQIINNKLGQVLHTILCVNKTFFVHFDYITWVICFSVIAPSNVNNHICCDPGSQASPHICLWVHDI